MKGASLVVRPTVNRGRSEVKAGIKAIRLYHSSTLAWWRGGDGLRDGSGTLTESYTAKPLASTVASQNDFITVLEKGAALPVGESDRLTAFRSTFQQTPATFGQRTRNGSAANQIARSNVATV